MYFTIHCGGMPFNGGTINEKALGGSETAAYYVAREIAKVPDNHVTLFTNSPEGGVWDGVRYVFAGEISEATPLGANFHYYAENTPMDVLIIQRHPLAFKYQFKSKLNLWWLHDLALHRTAPIVQDHIWNINSVLTVSEFHKKQVMEVYGFSEKSVFAWGNGVDLDLYDAEKSLPGDFGDQLAGRVNLLYAARPERGLENLVMPGGIMEKLITELPNANLLVCGYDNTVPQMQQLYQQLFRRCAELPNVTHLGALTKQELATLEMHVDAYLYPTTFEDTFCIMAIEAMAAGLPFIASEVAALPYTCKDSGAILIPNKSNEIDQDAFISKLKEIIDDYDARERIHYAQLEAAKEHTWERVTGDLLMHILNLFDKTNNANRVAIEYLYNSDIQAINHLLYKNYSTHEEIEDLYAFSRGNNEKLQQHYKEYEIGENSPDPIQLKPVDLSNNLRYVTVRNRIVEMQLSEGATILDIGCHYGEYIINLARDFPQYKFIGVDFLTHCIEFACEWAIKEKLNNVEFRIGDLSIPFDFPVTVEDNIDLYIAAEVLEHLPGDSWYKLEQIINNTNPHVAIPHVLITTPWGPWEAKSYKRVYPYRFHLHHFERTDLEEIFGNQEDYNVINVPEPSSGCGSYITTFKYSESFGTINYGRKNYMQAPRETIALCAIVKDAEKDIKRMLASITSYVDEIIIGIDAKTTDRTEEEIEQYFEDQEGFYLPLTIYHTPPATDVGFDVARNDVIGQAKSDWILWLDSDEYLFNGQAIAKYLKHNMLNGYSIAQHHLSVDPPAIIKVDFPVRIFRNNIGIQFYGCVHEHPEKEINKGVEHAMIIPDVRIMHHGYVHEDIRRGRFDRNIDLLARDREEYPERYLGMFLWIRDLAQMTNYEMEINGPAITDDMRARAKEGISLWRKLLEADQLRMCIDALPYYSILSKLQGKNVSMGFTVDAVKGQPLNLDKARKIEGTFADTEDFSKLFNSMVNQRTANYDSKYF